MKWLVRMKRLAKRGGLYGASWVFLLIAKVAIGVLPFTWIVKMMGSSIGDEDAVLTGKERYRTVQVGRAIEIASSRVPWKSKCLDQALAAQIILRMLRVESVLHLGLRRNEGVVDAHAWLVAGGLTVTGGKMEKDYVSVFSNAKVEP